MSKKALVVRGGWKGHTPVEASDIFVASLKDEGYDVTVSDTLDSYTDEALMGSVDLIVQCVTMSDFSGEQWKGLNKAVYAGAGFAGWHGGIIDSFRNNTGYQFMTGGQWVDHPGGCEPTYTVNITDADHPITQGISDFELSGTEQYYCHVDPGVHVLATTVFSGKHGDPTQYPANTVMPYAWTRTWGKGKVFVAAWGHTFEDFNVPQAKKMVENGLKWATK
jgi:type 1 glutamine amidotransferase